MLVQDFEPSLKLDSLIILYIILMFLLQQNILTEGDICASQRRAACEGLGLLARLGNDIFTARMVCPQCNLYKAIFWDPIFISLKLDIYGP